MLAGPDVSLVRLPGMTSAPCARRQASEVAAAKPEGGKHGEGGQTGRSQGGSGAEGPVDLGAAEGGGPVDLGAALSTMALEVIGSSAFGCGAAPSLHPSSPPETCPRVPAISQAVSLAFRYSAYEPLGCEGDLEECGSPRVMQLWAPSSGACNLHRFAVLTVLARLRWRATINPSQGQ